MKRVLLLLAALLPAACATDRITGHVSDPNYAGDPHRVLVAAVLDRSWSAEAPDAFKASITAELMQCGITVEVYEPSTLELNQNAKAQALLASFQPDAVLSIGQTTRLVSQYGTLSGNYVATFFIPSPRKEVWKADLALAGGAYGAGRSDAAADLARKIVIQMVSDGVLRSCQPQAPK